MKIINILKMLALTLGTALKLLLFKTCLAQFKIQLKNFLTRPRKGLKRLLLQVKCKEFKEGKK